MGNGASVADKLSEDDVKNALTNPDLFDKNAFDRLKDKQGFITKRQFQSELYEKQREIQLQKIYCLFAPNDNLTSEKLTSMLKNSKIIDDIRFTTYDSDEIFAKCIPKNHHTLDAKMSYEIFRSSCIREVALKKGGTEHNIITSIMACTIPELTSIQESHTGNEASSHKGTNSKGEAVKPGKADAHANTKEGPVIVMDNLTSDLLDKIQAGVREETEAANAAVKIDDLREQKATKIQAMARGRMQRNAIKRVNAAPVLSAAEVLEQIGHERSRLLLAAFVKYAPDGEMEGRKFAKMMVASGLTGPKFTTNDADIVFAKCKKYVADSNCASGVLKINYAAFEAVALQPIAEKLGISLSDVADAVCHSQAPAQSVRGIKR